MTAGIFISYRRADSAPYAGRLHDHLTARFGEDRVFMDLEIRPGDDFVDRLQEGVGSCEVLLVLIGPSWLTVNDGEGRPRLEDPEDFARIEVAAALNRKIRVIPILVGGATMPSPKQLPDEIAGLGRRMAIELSDSRFRADADRLIGVIEEELARRTEQRERREPDGREAGEAEQRQREAEERRKREEDQRRKREEEERARRAADDRRRAVAAAQAPPASAEGVPPRSTGSRTPSWLTPMRAGVGLAVVLALVVGGLVLAAGGGDDPSSGATAGASETTGSLTVDEWAAQADQICEQGVGDQEAAAKQLLREQGIGPNDQPTPDLVRQLATQVAIPSIEDQVNAIKALPVPEDAADQVNAFLQQADAYVQAIKNDPSQLINRSALDELARGLDLNHCATTS